MTKNTLFHETSPIPLLAIVKSTNSIGFFWKENNHALDNPTHLITQQHSLKLSWFHLWIYKTQDSVIRSVPKFYTYPKYNIHTITWSHGMCCLLVADARLYGFSKSQNTDIVMLLIFLHIASYHVTTTNKIIDCHYRISHDDVVTLDI